MKKMTISIPVGRDGVMNGEVDISGEVLGPFIVHQRVDGTPHGPTVYKRLWNVTHVGSRFSAARDIPNKQRAIWLARKLAEHEWWSFTNPRAARRFTPEQLNVVRVLIADAKFGDCQGKFPA